MSDYADLKARLSIKADMIQLGEKIEWGSDSAIMREAAAALTVEKARVAKLVEREMAELRAKLAVAVEALEEIADGWTTAADDDTGELVSVRISEDEMEDAARAELAQIKGE